MRYVYDKWINGDFISHSLRPITRENKRYLVSDVQRTVKDWKTKSKNYDYVFNYRWATKYYKDKSPLGFRRSITHLTNTDGHSELKVSDDPSIFKCEYTFDEVFGNDLRDIQDVKDSPLDMKILLLEEIDKTKPLREDYYKLTPRLYNFDDKYNWDLELIKYLMELFKVKDVYYIPSHYRVSERRKFSILSKTGVFFQVNTFGDVNKKAIKNNYMNRSLTYWLFENRLVYQYEDGKSTW